MSDALKPIHIIGGGLAGSEAAWQIANAGVPVIIHEMRPVRPTNAHQTDGLAELVCSNSFRSDDAEYNAVGLLHAEMRALDSIIMKCGDEHQVPAGGALAVDRDAFSQAVTAALESHPLISIERDEVAGLPPEEWDNVIIATGPLTSDALAEAIGNLTEGEEQLSFYDAIAPIVYTESIDMSKAWYQSRYDKVGPGGDGKDYINCPLTEQEYYDLMDALLEAEYTEFKEWEKTSYFEGCLPIEVMAERGRETLRFGPMKPIGLTNPHSDQKPYAVVQLRQDNKLRTLYNIVGFQTKMKYGEQKRIFKMIPGLENAEFARLGGIHRNTFINSPRLLDRQLRLKAMPRLRFAGQVTGVEGYVESASMGLLAGRLAAAERLGKELPLPPETTALGALLGHITIGAESDTFQPMNVNFGLFPPPPVPEGKKKIKGKDRKKAYTSRALEDLQSWKENI